MSDIFKNVVAYFTGFTEDSSALDLRKKLQTNSGKIRYGFGEPALGHYVFVWILFLPAQNVLLSRTDDAHYLHESLRRQGRVDVATNSLKISPNDTCCSSGLDLEKPRG